MGTWGRHEARTGAETRTGRGQEKGQEERRERGKKLTGARKTRYAPCIATELGDFEEDLRGKCQQFLFLTRPIRVGATADDLNVVLIAWGMSSLINSRISSARVR